MLISVMYLIFFYVSGMNGVHRPPEMHHHHHSDKKRRNYKLIVDPTIHSYQGNQKVYRFDGINPVRRWKRWRPLQGRVSNCLQRERLWTGTGLNTSLLLWCVLRTVCLKQWKVVKDIFLNSSSLCVNVDQDNSDTLEAAEDIKSSDLKENM